MRLYHGTTSLSLYGIMHSGLRSLNGGSGLGLSACMTPRIENAINYAYEVYTDCGVVGDPVLLEILVPDAMVVDTRGPDEYVLKHLKVLPVKFIVAVYAVEIIMPCDYKLRRLDLKGGC